MLLYKARANIYVTISIIFIHNQFYRLIVENTCVLLFNCSTTYSTLIIRLVRSFKRFLANSTVRNRFYCTVTFSGKNTELTYLLPKLIAMLFFVLAETLLQLRSK